jgi:putative PIN family toxin of toxin-antitoxin system
MIPLRLVIDTNILVSAALKPDGLQRTVLLLATTKPATLYVSETILAEYGRVLARPELKIRRGPRQQLLQFIRSHSHPVKPLRALQVAKDPDDNKFLECADAAHADYLVTGNQRDFPRFWKKTKVINSREFISIVGPHLLNNDLNHMRYPHFRERASRANLNRAKRLLKRAGKNKPAIPGDEI